jgi:TonB family protein
MKGLVAASLAFFLAAPCALGASPAEDEWVKRNQKAQRLASEANFTAAIAAAEDALAFAESSFGPEHQYVVASLFNLSAIYERRGKYDEAEPLLKRALTTATTLFGAESDGTLTIVDRLDALYRATHRDADADALERRFTSPDLLTLDHLDGVVLPEIVKKIEPVYPAYARDHRISGKVVLQATVMKDGSVHFVHILKSTDPSLNDAAVEAVRQWRYKPALKHGAAVPVQYTIRVDFHVS